MDTESSGYLHLSSLATFQLFAIAGVGALCTKLKIFGRKDVEGLIDYNEYLIPMLVFTQILKGFDITNLNDWLPVLNIFMIQVFIGFIVGFCLSYISANRHDALRFFISSFCFPQTLTLQLLIIDNFTQVFDSISLASGQTFGTTARNRALSYVLVCYLIEHLLRTTLGSLFLTIDADNDKRKGDEYHKIGNDDENNKEVQTKGIKLSEVFSVSFVIFIFTVLISFISPVKNALLDQNTIFYSTLFVSSDLFAKACKVMVIFVFGTAIPLIKLDACYLSPTIHIINIVTKLVILPIIGYFIIHVLFQGISWLKDPICVFIMIVQFSAPTGIGLFKTSFQRTQLGNDFLVTMTFQHIVAIVTFTMINSFLLTQLSSPID